MVDQAAAIYLARLILSDLGAAEAWVKTIQNPERRTPHPGRSGGGTPKKCS
jgi:hypothetical protein